MELLPAYCDEKLKRVFSRKCLQSPIRHTGHTAARKIALISESCLQCSSRGSIRAFKTKLKSQGGIGDLILGLSFEVAPRK